MKQNTNVFLTYMDGTCRACTHCTSKEYRRLSRMRSWFCENCKYVIRGSVVQDKHLAFFFFIGVEAYPKSWQTPIFYSQTLNTREGDAGNSHYKILYVKLSFSLCILTCRVPKMWVGQSSPHFSTCMYICKFNKKVSVINFFFKKKGGGCQQEFWYLRNLNIIASICIFNHSVHVKTAPNVLWYVIRSITEVYII